jgi:hypothetical protein
MLAYAFFLSVWDWASPGDPAGCSRPSGLHPEYDQARGIPVVDKFVHPSVVDPWHVGSDPDPAIFVLYLQDVNQKFCFLSFSAYYSLKVHLHHFSKITNHKEVTKL